MVIKTSTELLLLSLPPLRCYYVISEQNGTHSDVVMAALTPIRKTAPPRTLKILVSILRILLEKGEPNYREKNHHVKN